MTVGCNYSIKYSSERSSTSLFFFRKKGIEPVLIKGWAASRNYPEPFRRVYSDIDIAVDPRVYQKALELIDIEKVNIDLHRGLRHLDTAGWDDLFAGSKLVNLSGIDIRLLRPEDHLRVLCVHWLNDGGIYKEKLWDIFYAVKNRPADFDWERCLGAVGERRRFWIICTIGLAHRYLNLDICDLPFRDSAEKIPLWIKKALEREWASGQRLISLDICVHDRGLFLAQLKKRMPPNPLQATIEMEGDLRARSRVYYQFASFLKRINPSARRLGRKISRRKKKTN